MGLARSWSRMVVIGLTFVAGCGSGEGGAAGDSALLDSALPDSALPDPALPDAAPGSCTTPLVGDSPFGATLTGDVVLALPDSAPYPGPGPHQRTVTLDVFFPEGRRPGAPVVLSGFSRWESWVHPGAVSSRTTLDDSLAATVFWRGKLFGEDAQIEGTLMGPDGGIEATVTMNLADASSDLGAAVRATVHVSWPDPAGCESVELALVSADGNAVRGAVIAWSTMAEGSPVDVSMELPSGSGPLWLSVAADATPLAPQWSVTPACVITLEDITLE